MKDTDKSNTEKGIEEGIQKRVDKEIDKKQRAFNRRIDKAIEKVSEVTRYLEELKFSGRKSVMSKGSILDKHIDDLNLSTRIRNCFLSNGIYTVKDIVVKEEQELRELRSFGDKSLAELMMLLEKHELHLGMDLPRYKDESSKSNT